MTNYLIGLYDSPDGLPFTDDELPQVIADVDAVVTEAKEAGVWVFGGGLHGPDSATTVTASADGYVVSDGPYLESKEHLGGFSIVDVPDLDTALAWAKKLASACRQTQEVRPFMEDPVAEATGESA